MFDIFDDMFLEQPGIETDINNNCNKIITTEIKNKGGFLIAFFWSVACFKITKY